MSEWLKEHDWKSCVGATSPWVRIPLSPLSSVAGGRKHAIFGHFHFRGVPGSGRANCEGANIYDTGTAPRRAGDH